MNNLFLFCGGSAIDDEGRPKPLMRIRQGRSLIVQFLLHLKSRDPALPVSITLLCDDGQELAFRSELHSLSYPVPVHVLACGPQASTFEKLERALQEVKDANAAVQFGYPDIFFFGEDFQSARNAQDLEQRVLISVTALTSRFPRFIVDVYANEIKGISNYSSPVPANPMHIFGGDLWARAGELLALSQEFRSQSNITSPSLEYDFFFWLINNMKTHCVMLYGEWLEIDSIRDVRRLLAKVGAT